MKQRLLRVLPALFVCSMAVVVFADKKTTSVMIKLVRLEGKGAGEEVVLNPTEFTIDKSVTWKKSADSSNDDPALEFTQSEPATLSCELTFDTFEEGRSVNQKIGPLENLLSVDQTLKRPPMVQVTFDPQTFPAFRGVLNSVETKYTLFLPDGTPVRATANIKLKKASSVSVGKNPCP